MSGSTKFNRLLTALLFSLFCAGLATAQGESSPPAGQITPSRPAVFPWIADVVKMNNAGVAPETILGYLKSTSARSILNADDIIYLQNQNVPPSIIAAMIEHGNAIPKSASVAATTPQTPPAQSYYPPPATYSAPAPAAAYTAPSASYAYNYPPDYANPYYYYYYSYPYNYYPGFSYFLPYTAIVTSRFHDRDHDRFFGHGLENHRFNGSVGTRAPGVWRPPVNTGTMRGGGTTSRGGGTGGGRGSRR